MKIGILTFQFAHNYGAVLQAASLKNYLCSLGYDAKIIGYKPNRIAKIYSLNPFKQSNSLASICSRFTRLPYRKKQYEQFEKFISELVENKSFKTKEEFIRKCNEFDVLICGSDQIWNSTITGENGEYFFEDVLNSIAKISYAASFGVKELNDYQQHCIKNYLKNFLSISTREEDGKKEIETILGKKVSIVLDPVFLTNKSTWENLTLKSEFEATEKFIFYDSLAYDEKLIRKTEKLSKLTGHKIYAVHPIATKQKIDGKQLYNVGPYEFLYLIKNAEYVCTDSFHASAFSIIFGKKYCHEKKSDKETRIESLLTRIDAYNASEIIDDIKMINLSNANNDALEAHICLSKKYLSDALELVI